MACKGKEHTTTLKGKIDVFNKESSSAAIGAIHNAIRNQVEKDRPTKLKCDAICPDEKDEQGKNVEMKCDVAIDLEQFTNLFKNRKVHVITHGDEDGDISYDAHVDVDGATIKSTCDCVAKGKAAGKKKK